MTDPTRPAWRYEFAGPIIEFIVTSGTAWEISVNVGNIGSTEELFVVVFQRRGIGGERFSTPVEIVPAQQSTGTGAVFEVDPGVDEFDAWWPRIYATSRELVPSIHFHVDQELGPSPPDQFTAISLPFRNPFYVSPNDFVVREVRPPLLELPTPPIGGVESADRVPTGRWKLRERAANR
jgi:hypothetical protein